MNRNHVASDHLWTFDNSNMDFTKNLGLKGKYCYHPFNTITVDKYGDVYLCICQAWLPISVGKIWEFNNFEEIVTSQKALEIQASIIDGSYRYCDNNNCSILQENTLSNRVDHRYHTVNWINFAIDDSCNLTCPSCRKEFKFTGEGAEFDLKIKTVNHLIKLIENHSHYLKFTLSGDGDPFASLVYRHFLTNLNLNKFPKFNEDGKIYATPITKNKQLLEIKQKLAEHDTYGHTIKAEINKTKLETQRKIEIELITNGVLLKDYWHKINKVHKNIIRTKISFDAGSESVYSITRRGANWNKLLENVEFLVKWKQKNYSNMIITANFVVQTINYTDMPAFVQICERLSVDEINFQKITDWGTFDNFNEHAVWKENHSEHKNFLNIVHSLNNKKINFTNLTDLKNKDDFK